MHRYLLALVGFLTSTATVQATPLDLKFSFVSESGDPLRGGFHLYADSAPAAEVFMTGAFNFSTLFGTVSGSLPGPNATVFTASGTSLFFPVDPATGVFTQSGRFYTGSTDLSQNWTEEIFFYAGHNAASWIGSDPRTGRYAGGDGYWAVSGLAADPLLEHPEPASFILVVTGLVAGGVVYPLRRRFAA